MPDPTRKRPFGIYAIIALLLINALSIFVDGAATYLDVAIRTLPSIDDTFVIRAIDNQVAVLLVIVAVGIWSLRRWAWTVTMILIGIGLASGLLRYARGTPLYLNMLLNILTVFYLNQRNVQVLFTRRRTARVAA